MVMTSPLDSLVESVLCPTKPHAGDHGSPGQILHMGRDHVYTRHLHTTRDDIPILEPAQQEGKSPHGKDKRPLTTAPRETYTHEVKLVFPKTEAHGALESADATVSQVSLEGLPSRALPACHPCCWDPTMLPSEAADGSQIPGSCPVLST